MSDVLTWIGSILLLAGVALTFVAAIGLIRMKDPWTRMHAASKPQLLGLLLVCAGVAVEVRTAQWAGLAVLIVIIQVITAPVGSHLIARGVDRGGRSSRDSFDDVLDVDDLGDDLAPGAHIERN
ncbi:monovalent cation/H(+) antiporter subunit G [Actinomyces sp. B33]|uniref:monovalent cation/H(+) antiporter subunit G n=1 Tax=Actinomyces sp. B33 TaxID=2942131 RepID=UPI0023404E06|nr:monovalent cation/H(+) antiporter subunit G [Actinomyces sp. B33]MDC4233470.1 monovalent cation/H(+) antiporter subunit G [Actinomyces sp. B33]